MKTKLMVKHFDGTTFNDISRQAGSFKRDSIALTLTTDHFIYVGFRKQINALFVQLDQVNTNISDINAEYFNGSWTPFDLDDCTGGFERSGFLHWDRVEDGTNVEVDGMEACWWRFSVDADTTEIVLQAINILFSDDDCICVETPALIDPCFYREGQTSHVLYHLSARDKILNDLRRLGYVGRRGEEDAFLDEWDILEIEEFKQAATYYAISQIYFNLSDSPDDQYWRKYEEYMSRYNQAFALSRVQIDQNDDGIAQNSEAAPRRVNRWFR